MIKEAQLGWVSPARERRPQRTARRGLPLEFFGVLYFCLIVLAGGLLVWQPAKVAQMNEQIESLQSTLKDLRLESESLKKAVSATESLGYIEQEARTRLGMVAPSEVRTFAVAPDASVGGGDTAQVAGTQDTSKDGGIFSLLSRIAQIFGAKEATAKGQR